MDDRTDGLDVARVRRVFPRLDPDVPLRYRPVLDRIPDIGRTLEIGRGEVGLAHLSSRPTVTCDIRRPTARAPLESFVLASGTSLPFRSRAFDAVVVVDVLEHIHAPRRREFLREIARVARDRILLTGPLASSARAEARVRRILRGLRGMTNPWLDEHAAMGLPEESEILASVPLGWSVGRVPNVNVGVWTLSRIWYDVTGVAAWSIVGLGGLLDFGTTYRTLYDLRRQEKG